MTGTDRIKIMLFHQHKIFFHLLYTYHRSGFRIGIMTVYSAELNFLSIKI